MQMRHPAAVFATIAEFGDFLTPQYFRVFGDIFERSEGQMTEQKPKIFAAEMVFRYNRRAVIKWLVVVFEAVNRAVERSKNRRSCCRPKVNAEMHIAVRGIVFEMRAGCVNAAPFAVTAVADALILLEKRGFYVKIKPFVSRNVATCGFWCADTEGYFAEILFGKLVSENGKNH